MEQETKYFTDNNLTSKSILDVIHLKKGFNFKFSENPEEIDKKRYPVKLNEIIENQRNREGILGDLVRMAEDFPYLGVDNFILNNLHQINNLNLDWDLISSYDKLTFNFIDTFFPNLNWDLILKYYNIPEQLLDKYFSTIRITGLEALSSIPDLSLEFILKYVNYLDIDLIIDNNRNLTREFFEILPEYMYRAGEKLNMNSNYYEEYQDSIDWWEITNFQNIPQNLINKYISEIDPNKFILVYKDYSYALRYYIIKYKNDVDWVKYLEQNNYIDDLIFTKVVDCLPIDYVLNLFNYNSLELIKYFPTYPIKQLPYDALSQLRAKDYFYYTSNIEGFNHLHLTSADLQWIADNFPNYKFNTSHLFNFILKTNDDLIYKEQLLQKLQNQECLVETIKSTTEFNYFKNNGYLIDYDYLINNINFNIDYNVLASCLTQSQIDIFNINLLKNINKDKNRIIHYFNSNSKTEYISSLIYVLDNRYLIFEDVEKLLRRYDTELNIIIILIFTLCNMHIMTIYRFINYFKLPTQCENYINLMLECLRRNKAISTTLYTTLFNDRVGIGLNSTKLKNALYHFVRTRGYNL